MAVRGVAVRAKTKNHTAGRNAESNIDDRTWTDPDVTSDEEVARRAMTRAISIEKWQWSHRYASLVYARYMSGRDTMGAYAYSVSARPYSVSLATDAAVWRPPTYNAIATVGDVYATRIFKNRPFIDCIPLGEGGFKGRVRAKKLTKFGDAVFYATKFWETCETLGYDCMEQGAGIIKTHEDQSKPGTMAHTRVLADELLIDDIEGLYGDPHSILQRAFMHRRDVAELARRVIKDEKKLEQALTAIKNAQSVQPAFGPVDRSYSQIMPLIEGWSKPLGNAPGKHILVIQGFALINEAWTHRWFPFSILRFKPLTTNWKGQGLVEQCLPLQAELDRCMSSNSESNERVGYPRVFVEAGSQVGVESLAGLPGGVITYTGTAPVFTTPPSIGADNLQWFNIIEQRLFKRAGISEAAAGGVKPQGLNSGAALMAWAQIDDTRHVDLSQRFESFVEDVFMKTCAVAEDVKPKVVCPGAYGQVIDWEDAKMTVNLDDLTSSAFRARAFPMSRLPQTIAGREQQISDWLANGQITREQAMRAGLIPDTESLGDLQTAVQDAIDYQLDCIIDEGEFLAPNPFGDPALTLQTAQSRYLRESTLDTPKDRLRLLLQYIQCASDNISDASAPVPGPVGLQGAAPAAPSPMQVPAAQGAPLAA